MYPIFKQSRPQPFIEHNVFSCSRHSHCLANLLMTNLDSELRGQKRPSPQEIATSLHNPKKLERARQMVANLKAYSEPKRATGDETKKTNAAQKKVKNDPSRGLRANDRPAESTSSDSADSNERSEQVDSELLGDAVNASDSCEQDNATVDDQEEDSRTVSDDDAEAATNSAVADDADPTTVHGASGSTRRTVDVHVSNEVVMAMGNSKSHGCGDNTAVMDQEAVSVPVGVPREAQTPPDVVKALRDASDGRRFSEADVLAVAQAVTMTPDLTSIKQPPSTPVSCVVFLHDGNQNGVGLAFDA